MKSWVVTLIVLCVFKTVSKLLLQKGEDSPLYGPLRFLIAMILILSIIAPLFPMLKNENILSEKITLFSEDIKTEDVNVLLLKRFAEKMHEKVKENFPESEAEFEIHTDEAKTPVLIKVKSKNNETSQKIAQWIETNYGIESKMK